MATKKKQMQKFCTIKQWIEMKDADFAKVFDELCMSNALLGRIAGATFLYPSAATRKQIIGLTFSETPEKAIDHLNAHIIQAAVRNVADFRKGEIGSRLGVLLEIESANDTMVTLKGGAKLKLAGDFQPLSRDNIAVWEVESGEVPLKGPEFKVPPRGRRAVVGSAEPPKSTQTTVDLTSRQILATTVEAAYDNCMRTNRCKTYDPYLTHVVSLLNFLKMHRTDVLIRVLPIIDRNVATTFYLLIEPYKTHGTDYMIEDSILFGPEGWGAASEIYEKAVTEFDEFFKMLDTQTTPSAEDRNNGNMVVPWIFRGDPTYIRSLIDGIRLEILGEDASHSNKIKTPAEVDVAYTTLVTRNSIRDGHPILPDETIRHLQGSKKHWQDDFRFKYNSVFGAMHAMPEYKSQTFHEIIRAIRTSSPGNNYSKEITLSNAQMLREHVAPKLEMTLFHRFINSTYFLYIPVSSEKINGGWGDIPVSTEPDIYNKPNDFNIYNAEVEKQRRLNWYKDSGHDEPHALNRGCITAAIHYATRNNGQLMPGYQIVKTTPRADNIAPN